MWDRRRAAWGRGGGLRVDGTVCFFCPLRPGRPFLVVMGAAATEPAALRAFARSGYGVGCAKMGGGRAAGVAFPSPGSFGAFWELARSRCFRTLTGRALCSSVALVHRSRVRPLARSALVADGVARWWRHDDEQEAGPVSAALLNAFLNSADFICRAYMWSNRAIAGSLGRRLRSCSRLGHLTLQFFKLHM